MLESPAFIGSVPELNEKDLICRCAGEDNKEAIKTFVILGRVRSGKTTRLLHLIDRISALGLRVGGICQPEDNGVYFAQDLETSERRWIARRENDTVFFNPETFDWAAQKIIRARASCDVLAIDEIGRLEGLGKGHLPALLQPVDKESAFLRILAVREDAFTAACRFLPALSGVIRV